MHRLNILILFLQCFTISLAAPILVLRDLTENLGAAGTYSTPKGGIVKIVASPAFSAPDLGLSLSKRIWHSLSSLTGIEENNE
ncbi:hypothetical protein MMC21_004071 [Puttea exsequens]|nr:hypothetical protein [Puttea exsequens]